MANHGDAYFDESLENEDLGNGIPENEYDEGIELIDDGSADPPSPFDGPVDAEPSSVVPPVWSAEDQELLAEIEKARNKSTGVGALFLTVLISAVLFVAAGTAWWPWQLTLTLVPILLIHELGHFVTMKSFKYRNVNMFFIPLLGAAVTGQHFNVPAWKKAIVALMGPLPSIFLALCVGVAAIVLKLDWLVYACMVTLFLNGLNLVPLLPFDGGHVLHAVVFCRHYYLDVALRLITVGVVVTLAVVLGGSWFFIGLAVFLIMTLPITVRNGKTARQLRSEGCLETVTEDDRIIPAVAVRIAHALRKRMKVKINTKALAQFTLQVVEQINTRPPGLLASIGLLFLHVGGMSIALLGGVGLGIAVDGEIREGFLLGLQPSPLYAYDCDATETPGDQYIPTRGMKIIVATFATPADANAAYVAAMPNLSPRDHLQRFGQSVSVSLDRNLKPKDLQVWIDRWEAKADEVLVDAAYTDVVFALDATFPSPELAQRVQNELRAYFKSPLRYVLSPPWQPDALVLEPGVGDQYQARWSLVVLEEAMPNPFDDDERTAAAMRIGDYDEVERITNEIKREAADRIKATVADLDTVTVELYMKRTLEEYDAERWQQLVERVGGTVPAVEAENAEPDEDKTIEEDDGGTAAQDDGSSVDRKTEDKTDDAGDGADSAAEDDYDEEAYYTLNGNHERYAAFGSVIGLGTTVSLRSIYFNVTAEGAKAIVDWLCSLGASDVTYAFHNSL